MKCQRCGAQSSVFRYSWYNDQRLCEACAEAETKRHDYAECRKAEAEAIRRGDLNFNFKPDLGLNSSKS